MNIPSFPASLPKFVDKNLNLHTIANSFFTTLMTVLQQNLSDQGYVIPMQDSATLAQLAAQGIGKIIFNSDTQKMNINNNGTFQEIYTRPQQLTSVEIAAIPTADINGTWTFNTDTSELLYGINNTFRQVAYT